MQITYPCRAFSFVDSFAMGTYEVQNGTLPGLPMGPSVTVLPPLLLGLFLFCPQDVREQEMQAHRLKGIARVLVWLLEETFPVPFQAVALHTRIYRGGTERGQRGHWQGWGLRKEAIMPL